MTKSDRENKMMESLIRSVIDIYGALNLIMASTKDEDLKADLREKSDSLSKHLDSVIENMFEPD